MLAQPTKGEAKKQFDRGVAAYSAGDYETASDALGKSYALQNDQDTLFALAQAERKLDHCDKAIVFYEKLLTFTLPDENKQVVTAQLEECKQKMSGDTQPALDGAAGSDATATPTEPAQPTTPVAQAGDPDMNPLAKTAPTDTGVAPAAEGRAWYKDPVSDALFVTGIAALGFGTAMIVSASSANSKEASDNVYSSFKSDNDTAQSHGKLAVIGFGAGVVLAGGGVVWLLTHRDSGGDSKAPAAPAVAPVSAWVAPGAGGVAFGGHF